MQIAPTPANEPERLARLEGLGVLDTLPQKAFDDITALASSICGTPIALISLVDQDRQWFKSRIGLDAKQTSRELAFCAHAILKPDEVMVVEDATLDPRFHDNPLVAEAPNIRFYAGAPIVMNDGLALGTVCVIDQAARQISAEQKQALRSLSNLVVSLLDQERLRKGEEARNSAKARRETEVLHAMITTGLDLKSFVDLDYTYQFANPTYLHYWHCRKDEVVGRKVMHVIGAEQFESKAKPSLDRAFRGELVRFEVPMVFPKLGVRQMDVAFLPAHNPQGNIIGAIVRAQDIQERKEREDRMRETVAMLEHKTLEQERFIHIVSHDLREPINSINNFTLLLSSDETLNLPDTAKRYLGFVAAGGQRMAALLDGLMGFLRLERHAVHHELVDFTQLASQVRDDLHAALKRSGGRVEVDHMPAAWGDPSLLRIALQNLVANGIKFVAKGTVPVVRVTAAHKGAELVIAVQDNGIGMPADQLDKIFEMFKRLHTRKEYAGTGLGLSICRRVAELHGGQVGVTSTLGQGTCFTLCLPMAPGTSNERNGDEQI